MTKINARLVGLTQPTLELKVSNPEGIVAYCARVSNPKFQDKEIGTLFDYCVRNKHWSVFEMVNAVVEVEAPRDITRQLLRHRSFSFQEFSQRYSDEIEFTDREFRRQDAKNRQNSVDDLPEDIVQRIKDAVAQTSEWAQDDYARMREFGVAKECARVILPEGLTMSRLYVNGTLRSWLHYLEVRDDEGVTQWEHVQLARKIKEVLLPAFPTVFGLLEEKKEEAFVVSGTEYYNS
jgi:thymidylate synthase (FAD)